MSKSPSVIKDEIEREVCRIWLESPGIGVKELMQKLTILQLSSEITKQRVKAAKQAIPYRYIPPDISINTKISEKQISFVEQKIQERTSVRSLRRYKDADEIMKGLTFMGIILDDGMKTWTITKTIPSETIYHKEISKNIETITQKMTGVACKFCNRYFASKNLVFRHLRDVSTSCGNAIFANGDKLPDAPSAILKRQKQEKALVLRNKNTGKAKEHTDPTTMLWFGDLPVPFTRLGGQYRRLRAVLRACLPRDVPQPWIKKVVRKAYRKGGEIIKKGEEHGVPERDHERGEYFGYAIIVFRDKKEACKVKTTVDGAFVRAENVFSSDSTDATDMPSFVIKVKNVLHNQASSSNGDPETNGNTDINELNCDDKDPPLIDQLRPLSISELQERCKYLRQKLEANGKFFVDPEAELHSNDENGNDNKRDHMTSKRRPRQEQERMLELAVSLYNAAGPRDIVFHQGSIIPESIRENLLYLLRNVRWPAASHRKGLTSDHYLVLQSNVANDIFYDDLRISCRELMDWADPSYYYSGIAVTKNFIGSPHIDDRDQSFQYAVSLGDFSDGGELCVEGRNAENLDYVNVVETRNRIAKVDGRNVHWVRRWNGGKDRYSLIFYDTTDRYQTEVVESGILT